MAMATATVMATEADCVDWRARRLPHPLSGILARPVAASAPARLVWRVLTVALGCFGLAASAHAEWRFASSAGISETFTSDVSAGVNGNSDFVTAVNGALAISGTGARVHLNGTIGGSVYFYANESQNNSFAPSVALSGNVEAIEHFLFVDAQAYVSQTFLSPFGPQPGNAVNTTANRYTSQTYSISPYIRGAIPGTKMTYNVRDDNIWTLSNTYGNSSLAVPGTYFNQLYGSIGTPVAPWGWTAEYTRSQYEPSQRDTVGSYTIQVARGIAIYQYDPQLQVSARGGYEKDQFPLTGSQSVIYGVGLQWLPSDRTQATGFWEHRFFGASYSAQISHRLPRTALAANFFRGITSYPQNALSIPVGANVATFVDAAFATRIPDPAERALAVQQFVAQAGLPATLATPVNIFATTVQLQTGGSASAVLIGVRNSLAFNVFYTKTEAISGKGTVLPPALQFGQDTTQAGGGVSFSHRLSGMTSLTASATYSTTRSNTTTGAFANARSNNGYLNLGLSTQLGPRTTGSFGANYTRYLPNGDIAFQSTSSYSISAAVNHNF